MVKKQLQEKCLKQQQHLIGYSVTTTIINFTLGYKDIYQKVLVNQVSET